MTIGAQLLVDPNRTLGVIDDRIYGTFAEHIGRVIYGGLFDPESELADDEGLRRDVIEALRGYAPSVIRWPGGNYVSGYHWRDGIGEQRNGRHDLAWDAFDPNTFGTEEFLSLCRRVAAAPYLAINASTGTIDEAHGWLEYCNGRHPVPEVLLRRSGPHPEPHDVKIWGIGNENYGWWQHLHTDAESFAELTREWGKLLYWADSSIEIVGVGASPFPDWNWVMLTEAGRSMDYLSHHFYWHSMEEDPYHSMLAGPIASERAVIGSWGMSLEAQRKLGLEKPVSFAVDEWGVWNSSQEELRAVMSDQSKLMRFGLTPKVGIDNTFEEFYDVKDALAIATWFNVMWRHPEKIRIATYAQVINTLAPLFVSDKGVLRQTIFFVLAGARKYAFGTALDLAVLTDHGVPAPVAGTAPVGGGGAQAGGSVPVVDVAGTTDGSRIHLSIVNRSREDEVSLRIQGASGPAQRITFTHEDPFTKNTPNNPNEVLPKEDKLELDGRLVVPPASHTTLVFGWTPS